MAFKERKENTIMHSDGTQNRMDKKYISLLGRKQ